MQPVKQLESLIVIEGVIVESNEQWRIAFTPKDRTDWLWASVERLPITSSNVTSPLSYRACQNRGTHGAAEYEASPVAVWARFSWRGSWATS